MRNSSLFVVAIVFLTAVDAYGREVPDWPYGKLMKSANVVVIGEEVSSKHVAYDFSSDKHFGPFLKNPHFRRIVGDKLCALLTTFRVVGLLKGPDTKESIQVLHFGWKDSAPDQLQNGPTFVTFRVTAQRVTITDPSDSSRSSTEIESKPQYLLFLRRNMDGNYEAVTGQEDPSFSVRLITNARR